MRCTDLSGNNLPRIKLIRGKLFPDRYSLPMTAYQCRLLFSVALVGVLEKQSDMSKHLWFRHSSLPIHLITIVMELQTSLTHLCLESIQCRFTIIRHFVISQNRFCDITNYLVMSLIIL